MSRFSRQDVLRILRLESRHLTSWEREGLVPAPAADQTYTFEHLSRLRTLRELKSKRLSARRIRVQAEAMQRVAGMHNALLETTAVRAGSRLCFRHGGALLDPTTQQLAFDFAASAVGPQLAVAGSVAMDAAEADQQLEQQLTAMFARAVQLEERTSTVDEAIEAYRDVLALEPRHAAASINLGTIFYHRRDFAEAESMYRQATEADPEYALAFFNLGNVLDEMQRLDDAIHAYRRAVALVPGYADAHYNLALAYERRDERRKALRHWNSYVRLDPVGPWAAHARSQARKILAMERLSIVSRDGRLVSAAAG